MPWTRSAESRNHEHLLLLFGLRVPRRRALHTIRRGLVGRYDQRRDRQRTRISLRGMLRRAEERVERPVTPGLLLFYSIQVEDEEATAVFQVMEDTSIGRAPDNQLVIEDTYMSLNHARIFNKDGSWYIEDLGSTNGTSVNRAKVWAPQLLQDEDIFRIGHTNFFVTELIDA